MNQLKIEYVDLEQLKPFVDNPRNHSERNVDDILQSMKRFGWTNPIIARRDDNMVIAGHGRIEAARLNGTEQVPVIFTDFTENDAKLYSITDNRTSETSDWDLVALNDLVKELDEMPDIDLDDSGFTSEELDDLLADVSMDLDQYADKDADAVPDVQETAQTQTGDIWHLGPHRVLCGDATKQDDVSLLMDGNKAGGMLTDPPYGIKASVMTLGTGKKNFLRGDWDKERVDLGSVLHPDIKSVVWGGNYYSDILPVTNDWLCWHKKNDGLSFSEFELAWTNLGKNTRHLSHHWSGEEKAHPTQKPLAVFVWCLKLLEVFEIIDPFLGSGTTLIASEKTGRQCYGMELDPHYCDVIARRYVDFVGTHADAWLERDGQRTHYSEMFDVLSVQIPTTDGSAAVSEAAL